MKFKRFCLFFLLLSLFLSLSACNKKTLHMDLFLYDASDTFIKELAYQITEEFKGTHKIRVYDSKRSQIVQNNQIVKAIDSKDAPDLLVVNPVDRLSCGSIINKANLKEIPVIFFNREPLYKDLAFSSNAYYVGTNPKNEGINQAKMALDLFKNHPDLIDKNHDNKLQCVFIRGEQSHQDTEKRTYSCISYFDEVGVELEVLDMVYANWNRDEGKEAMESFYQKFGDEIEFIFCNNDEMALGAADFFIEEINKGNMKYDSESPIKLPIPIVGVDGTKEGLKAIENGLIYGTTINDTLKQAKAIYGLLRLINKEIKINDFEQEYDLVFTNDRYIYVNGNSLPDLKNA